MAKTSTRRTGPARSGNELGARMAQAEMRAANMGLILRHLRSGGGRSRARLAAETWLSRATISSVVTELAARGPVREGPFLRDVAVGRPGQTVSLDGSRVAGIGLEISVHQAVLTALTLGGTVIREAITSLDVVRLEMDVVLDRVAGMLRRALDSLREAGVEVVGITVSPPGIIDYAAGALRFAPNLGWRGIPARDELVRRLGADVPTIHLGSRSRSGCPSWGERAEAGESRVLAALAAIAGALTPGLSILVDVLNPGLIVLGGYYAHFAEQLLPLLAAGLEGRRIDAGTAVDLAVSTLGPTASAHGGALLALDGVFDDPSAVGVPR